MMEEAEAARERINTAFMENLAAIRENGEERNRQIGDLIGLESERLKLDQERLKFERERETRLREEALLRQ